MEKNVTKTSNRWSSLATVTTFDKGNNGKTTLCLENANNSRTDRQLVGCTVPSTSLLIESLIQHLCTMFETEPARRNSLYFAICDKLFELGLIDSSYNIPEFEILRGQYQHALYRLVAIARSLTGSESPVRIPSSLTTEWSRYQREFQEISFIAAGGFGDVFKALHRLDGIEYAVKKIVVRSGRVNTVMQYLEEVKTLAKLNHTNIVPYKGAWIEPSLPATFVRRLPSTNYNRNETISSEQIASVRSCRSYFSNHLEIWSHVQDGDNQRKCSISESNRQEKLYNINTSHESEEIIKKSKCETIESSSDIVSFRSDSKTDYQCSAVNVNSNTDSYEESSSNQKLCQYNAHANEQYATLYIQMSLCEKTLHQWLDERETATPHTIIPVILTQITRGVDYIHSRNIVHHDIKPSNIFISTTGQVHIQLGDFGLACPLQRESHHSVLGTYMYAAPEQLAGQCNSKSDIYSIGIVLLELLMLTQTAMERISIIKSVKHGQIPTAITAKYPKWAQVVSQLVQQDPNTRPTTSQLLQDLNDDKDFTINELRNTIEKLQDKILGLEEEINKMRKSSNSA